MGIRMAMEKEEESHKNHTESHKITYSVQNHSDHDALQTPSVISTHCPPPDPAGGHAGDERRRSRMDRAGAVILVIGCVSVSRGGV